MENGQTTRTPIEQLQIILNAVLETTGKVLAEANRGADKDRAIAAASRLRNLLPTANDNFHIALDEIEWELHNARRTIRRDLIRLREREARASKEDAAPPQSNGVKEVDMEDAPPNPEPARPTLNGSSGDITSSEAPEAKASSKTGPDLQIDTSIQHPKPATTDAAEPGTAAMSVMDFESLFNDPDSARGSVSFSASPGNNDPPDADASKPATAPGEQDSKKTEEAAPPAAPVPEPVSLNADNSNEDMSNLLPGLESYANAPDLDNMVDLSTPTAQKPDETANGNSTTVPTSQPQDQPQQQSTSANTDEQRDTTFDDLMNFGDFDMGAFGDAAFGEGDGEPTAFDDNYFNLE